MNDPEPTESTTGQESLKQSDRPEAVFFKSMGAAELNEEKQKEMEKINNEKEKAGKTNQEA